MPRRFNLQTSSIVSKLRFVQGYRYLDRCGEALVKLEDVLDEGWIPVEATPSRGALRNYRLGMLAQFQSESMTVRQSEFISYEHLRDQTCKVYEILWNTFGINRVFTPALRVILQIGFEEVDQAEQFVRSLSLCTPSEELLALLDGDVSAARFTVCTEHAVTWQDVPVVRRRRLELGAIRQEKQPDFDERVMRRLALIPTREREAIGALMKLRREHPRVAPVAAQFDLENSHESEFASQTFDLASFMEESWKWTEHFKASIQRLAEETMP